MWHLIRPTKEEINQLMQAGKTEEEAKNKLRLLRLEMPPKSRSC
jgi:hypothetical protein